MLWTIVFSLCFGAHCKVEYSAGTFDSAEVCRAHIANERDKYTKRLEQGQILAAKCAIIDVD